MLGGIKLSVILLIVLELSVILPSVVAPSTQFISNTTKGLSFKQDRSGIQRFSYEKITNKFKTRMT
jgi:hypothetical protein